MLLDTLHLVLSSETARRLGWAILHSAWECTLVAAVLAVLLPLLRHARLRYVAACIALGAMVLLPAVTFQWLVGAPSNFPPRQTTSPSEAVMAPAGPGALSPVPSAGAFAGAAHGPGAAADARRVASSVPSTESGDAPAGAPVLERPNASPDRAAVEPPLTPSAGAIADGSLSARAEPLLPYMVLAWFVGVAILSVWNIGGWVTARRLCRSGATEAGAEPRDRLVLLARRLGLARPVRLLSSRRVDVPMVVGWLRPVLLVPAAILTGLPPQELDALLSHELAHIQRHDYLVNLLQVCIETLLFYHPAVWWVSRRIRIEREFCCDEIATQVCDPVVYAGALATLASLQPRARPGLALAATGSSSVPAASVGSTLDRVRRVLGVSRADVPKRTSLGGVLTLCALIAIAGLTQLTPHAASDAAPPAAPTPTTSPAPTSGQKDLPARSPIVIDFDTLLRIQDQLLAADDRSRPALEARERPLHEYVATALKRGDANLVEYIRAQVDDETKYPAWFVRANGASGGDMDAANRQMHAERLFAFLAYSPTYPDYLRGKLTRPGPPIYPEAQRYLVHCLVLHDIVRGDFTQIAWDLSDVATGLRPTPAKIEAALLMGHAGGELGFPGVTLSELDRTRYDEVTSVDQCAHYLNEALLPEGAIDRWVQEEKPCPGGFANAAVQALRFYGLSVRTYATEKALAAALKKEIDAEAAPTAADAMRLYDAPAATVYAEEEAQKLLSRSEPFTWLLTFPQIHGLKAYYLRMAGDPDQLESAIEKQISTANAQPGVFNRKRTLGARLMSLAAPTGHGSWAGTHLYDRLPAEWSQFLAEMYFCQLVRNLPPNDYDECLSVILTVSNKARDPQIFLPVALRLLVLSRDWRRRMPVLCDGGLLERQPDGQWAPIRHFHAMESVKGSASYLLKSADLGRLSALPRGTGVVLYSDVNEWLEDCLDPYRRKAAVTRMSERTDLKAAREEQLAWLVESHAPTPPASTPAAPTTAPATQPGPAIQPEPHTQTKPAAAATAPGLAPPASRPAAGEHTLTGWIQSPLLKRKRDFTDAGAAGVRYVLANEIDRRHPEIRPDSDPVAEGILDGAIRFRVYYYPWELSACIVTAVKLKEDPLWPETPVGQQLTFVQADVKYNNSGQKVDLAMDIATIPFKQSEQDPLPDAILASKIAPILRDLGSATAHGAAHWRLIERGLGWPAGEFGHAMTLAVVRDLQDACVTPDTPNGPGGPHLWHAALWTLVQLAKVDGSPDVQEALAQTRRGLRERGEYFGPISDDPAAPPQSRGPASGPTNRAPATTETSNTPARPDLSPLGQPTAVFPAAVLPRAMSTPGSARGIADAITAGLRRQHHRFH